MPDGSEPLKHPQFAAVGSIAARVLETLRISGRTMTCGEISQAAAIPLKRVTTACLELAGRDEICRIDLNTPTRDGSRVAYHAAVVWPSMPRPVGHLGIRLVPCIGVVVSDSMLEIAA